MRLWPLLLLSCLQLFASTQDYRAEAWPSCATVATLAKVTTTTTRLSMTALPSTSSSYVDFQKDYGRGQNHLSAFLEEGDVVVYQTGTWWVDGVQVGDGDVSSFEWAKIDTLQVVWSHNCEHGVLRGIALKTKQDFGLQRQLLVSEAEPMDIVEFGPEQLVARVPVKWEVDDQRQGHIDVQAFINDNTGAFWLQATGQGGYC